MHRKLFLKIFFTVSKSLWKRLLKLILELILLGFEEESENLLIVRSIFRGFAEYISPPAEDYSAKLFYVMQNNINQTLDKTR